jgi:hypothetical protein
MALAGALLSGCAGAPETPASAGPVPYQPREPVSEIERVPVRRLEPPAEGPLVPASIAVRAAGQPDIGPVERSRETTAGTKRTLESAGTIAAALAAAAPPLYAGTIALGALLVPAAAGLEIYERRDQDTIIRTLREVDLPTQLRSALVRRSVPAAGGPAAGVVVTVNAFGLAPRAGSCPTCPVCVVADAELVVTQGNTEVLRDPLQITAWRRSADAPPPVCATMQEFAADDGQLLRRAILDTAEILAGMTVTRLPGLAWAP